MALARSSCESRCAAYRRSAWSASTKGSEGSWDLHSVAVQVAYRAEGRARELLDAFFEARLIIEPSMAAMCAERASSFELDELGEIVLALFDGLRSPDPRVYRKADNAFHT